MKLTVITVKSIEKIGKIFEKQTGDAFFYAMRQHKHIWPKLVKCYYITEDDVTETVRMESKHSCAIIRADGKNLVVTIEADAPIFKGEYEIKFTLRNCKKNSETLRGKINGLALLLKNHIDVASSAVNAIPDKLKLYINIKWPN